MLKIIINTLAKTQLSWGYGHTGNNGNTSCIVLMVVGYIVRDVAWEPIRGVAPPATVLQRYGLIQDTDMKTAEKFQANKILRISKHALLESSRNVAGNWFETSLILKLF